MKISIRPVQVAKVLGGVICVLAVFSLIGQVSRHFLGHGRLLGFVHQFSLGDEGNIPTYVSTLLLLSAALLLGVIAHHAYRTRSPFRVHWAILSIIFVYISVDEFAVLHEHLDEPMHAVLDAGGIFYYAWVIPAMVLLVLFGIGYARFFWHLSPRWKLLFAAAGLIYVGGALGIEMIGGWYVAQYEDRTFTYELLVTVEEVMEKTGVLLFVYALLEYIRAHGIEVHLTVEEEKPPVSTA